MGRAIKQLKFTAALNTRVAVLVEVIVVLFLLFTSVDYNNNTELFVSPEVIRSSSDLNLQQNKIVSTNCEFGIVPYTI